MTSTTTGAVRHSAHRALDDPKLLPAARAEALAARRSHRILNLSPDDAVAYGALGLLEALERFDMHRGVPVGHFVRQRIRGAVLDGARAFSTLGRRTYETNRIADHPAERAAELREQAAAQLHHWPARPDDHLLRKERHAGLEAVLATLRSDDRQVLSAIYDPDSNDRSGAALARRLGVSRSTVSRRHQALLGLLRERLGAGHG